MHWLSDPSHVVMVLTACISVISEILPFLPSKAEGIVHGIMSLFQAGRDYEARKLVNKALPDVSPLAKAAVAAEVAKPQVKAAAEVVK